MTCRANTQVRRPCVTCDLNKSIEQMFAWFGMIFFFPILNNKLIISHFEKSVAWCFFLFNLKKRTWKGIQIPSWKTHIPSCPPPLINSTRIQRLANCSPRHEHHICYWDAGKTVESSLAACQASESRFLLTRLSINGQMASAPLAGRFSSPNTGRYHKFMVHWAEPFVGPLKPFLEGGERAGQTKNSGGTGFI